MAILAQGICFPRPTHHVKTTACSCRSYVAPILLLSHVRQTSCLVSGTPPQPDEGSDAVAASFPDQVARPPSQRQHVDGFVVSSSCLSLQSYHVAVYTYHDFFHMCCCIIA